LKSVKKVIEKHDDFRKHVQLWFQGGLNQSHWKTIKNLGLKEYVTDFGYLEHHNAVGNVMKADVLFLTLGERRHIDAVTPGKVFEYMGSKKPILAYIPEGVTRSLLVKYGAASCVGITDVDAGADAILKLFDQWKTNSMPGGSDEFIQTFDRLKLTEQLSSILDDMTEEIKAEADK
jgi:glycosyltransferase involved in cell wall biosynthesis